MAARPIPIHYDQRPDAAGELVEAVQNLRPHHLEAIGNLAGPRINAAQPLVLLCEPSVNPFEAFEHFPAYLFHPEHARDDAITMPQGKPRQTTGSAPGVGENCLLERGGGLRKMLLSRQEIWQRKTDPRVPARIRVP